MAENDEIVALLRQLVNQNEAQSKALEALSINSTKAAQANRAGGGGGPSPNQIAGRQLVRGAGLGGVMSSAKGGPAGMVLGAVQKITDSVVNDALSVYKAGNEAAISSFRGADPFSSGEAIKARANQNVRERTRVAKAGRTWKGEDWRTGFYNFDPEVDKAKAEIQNLNDRMRFEPQLRSINQAKNDTWNQLGGIAQFADIDDATLERQYRFNKQYSDRAVKTRQKLEGFGDRDEAKIRNSSYE